MQQKNYYQILEVSADCNAETIKKAYRKLALKYHPDVAEKNVFQEKKFAEIKEAYEVLINRESRRKFHEAYFFMPLENPIDSIHDVMPLAEKIELYIQRTNFYTIDYELICLHIEQLLSKNKMLLLSSNTSSYFGKLENTLFNCMQILPYALIVKIAPLYLEVFSNNQYAIEQLLKKKKIAMLWEKYGVVFAIIITVCICVYIALMS